MKLNQVVLILGFSVLANSAHAFLNVCELEAQPIEVSTNLNQEKIDAYRAKLHQECVVHNKYLELRQYSEQFGIPLEKIYLYQGLRYVDRSSYITQGRTKNLPMEFIFQVQKEDANKPLGQRSDLVWRNWAKGIEQLSIAKADIEQGKTIDIPYLQKIHIGFFTENESGDQGNVVNPGELKGGIIPAIYWNLKNSKDVQDYTTIANKLDETLKEMGLRPALVAEEDYVNKIFDVRNSILYPAAPRAVRSHLTNMLTFMNAVLAQARQNQPMIWKSQLFTPSDLAYFIQQYIVQIHGFNDGNGRTSRFWQDVLLALFDMPVGASGDLNSDDMTAEKNEYYHRAQVKSFNQLLDIEKCFTDVYPKVMPQNWQEKGLSISSLENKNLPYDCRILK